MSCLKMGLLENATHIALFVFVSGSTALSHFNSLQGYTNTITFLFEDRGRSYAMRFNIFRLFDSFVRLISNSVLGSRLNGRENGKIEGSEKLVC